jgi:small multidrug resistance family-3 protein
MEPTKWKSLGVAALTVAKSIGLFVLAGLFEIGGGWLMWQWIRNGKGFRYAVAGAVLLVLYGVLPNFQPAPAFGRVYAAYGGVFVVMSLLWDWRFDGKRPDSPDLWGSALCLVGVAVIMYWPRK